MLTLLILIIYNFFDQNESKLRQTESVASKMESNESIILQMNKERLRLERQLSLLMKVSFLLFDYSCYFPQAKNYILIINIFWWYN